MDITRRSIPPNEKAYAAGGVRMFPLLMGTSAINFTPESSVVWFSLWLAENPLILY